MKRGSGIAVAGVTVMLIALAVMGSGRVDAARGKQVTFTGRVLTAAGAPMEGIQVRLYQETYGDASYSYQVAQAAEIATKADGSFSFALPAEGENYRSAFIVAEKPGLAIGFDSWNLERDKKSDLMLGEAKRLAGVVVDESGQPVPDAAVSIYLLQIGDAEQQRGLSMHVAPRLLTTRTDLAGRFGFTNLPGDATAELLVKKPGRATVCTFASSEYSGRPLHYRVGQTDIRLTQPAEAKIEGIVIQKQTGQPVAGITLIVTDAGNQPLDGYEPVDSDVDGTFRLPALPAGQHGLHPRSKSADWVGAVAPVTVKSGEAVTGLKIEVTKGGILEIVVTDAASNKPLEKASAGVHAPQGNQWFYGTSNAEGIARIRLAPGTYEVEGVSKQGYDREQRLPTVTIEEGTTKRVAVALKVISRVRGIVRDPNGAPLGGAQVRIMPGGQQEATSDAEGRFEARWDRQGRDLARTIFCVVAWHQQRNLAAVADLTEGASALEVKLEPGVTITGRIADPNGKGIAGARVAPMLFMGGWGSSLNHHQTQTDSSGRFEIRTVPAGHKYELYVSADGYGSKSSTQVDAYGAAKGRLDVGAVILLPASLAVSGWVVDLQDNPVARATLVVYGEDQPGGARTQADAQGRFTLRGVCAGLVNIEVRADQAGKRLSARVLTDAGSTDVKIVLREDNPYLIQRVGGKSYDQIVSGSAKVIAGVAIDGKGTPVAGVPVQVRCHKTIRDGKEVRIFSDFRELSATTDTRGRFAIELKEDGQYNLLFSPDRQAAVIAYDVPVGQKELKVVLPEGGTVTGRLVRIEKGRQVAVPGAEIKVEQTSRWAFSHLGFDRDRKTVTDAEGRFRVEHLATEIRAEETKPGFVPRTWKVSHGDTSQTIAFDDGRLKEVELVIKPDLANAPSLIGKPLAGFDGIKLSLPAEQSQGKRVLVCFFDWEQRPSRNAVLQLAKQAPALRERGVAVAAVHVSKENAAGLQKWAMDNGIPFPVGSIQGDREEVSFAWSIKSLPWLVLTDTSHTVTAEGFTPSELDKKLAEKP